MIKYSNLISSMMFVLEKFQKSKVNKIIQIRIVLFSFYLNPDFQD